MGPVGSERQGGSEHRSEEFGYPHPPRVARGVARLQIVWQSPPSWSFPGHPALFIYCTYVYIYYIKLYIYNIYIIFIIYICIYIYSCCFVTDLIKSSLYPFVFVFES